MSKRTITRADLYDAAYLKAGSSVREAGEVVELVLAEIVNALARGETVKIASFGTFVTRKKAGRTGRNPKTGAPAPISPRRVLLFRPSQVLKGRIQHALSEKEQPLQRLSSPPAPEPAMEGPVTGGSRNPRTTRRSG
jgi:integration host factor subunit alpha